MEPSLNRSSDPIFPYSIEAYPIRTRSSSLRNSLTPFEDSDSVQVLYKNDESQEDEVNRLRIELAALIKSRDESIETRENELKQAKKQNEELEHENQEVSQEIKILYTKLDNLHYHHEQIEEMKRKHKELEEKLKDIYKSIEQTTGNCERIIKELDNKEQVEGEDSNNHSMPSNMQILKEKQEIVAKGVEFARKLLQTMNEKYEIKAQLIGMKLRYAEVETEKNELHKRILDQKKQTRTKWSFLNFWKKIKK
jgi:chromosome segregation ATPase